MSAESPVVGDIFRDKNPRLTPVRYVEVVRLPLNLSSDPMKGLVTCESWRDGRRSEKRLTRIMLGRLIAPRCYEWVGHLVVNR